VKNILILGATGTIGNALYRELSSYYNTYGTYYKNDSFDNKNFFYNNISENRLDYIFKKVKPKLIINALRGPSDDLIKTHKKSVLYCSNNNCRLLLISGSNVFDAFHNYPSYEYDKTLSESKYGRLQIKLENITLKLSYAKYVLIRSSIVFGSKSPRIKEIDLHIQKRIPIEVFPNAIINFSSLWRLTQQIHFIINHNLSGIFHLGTKDLIPHSELIEKIINSRYFIKPIFKRVYSSNEIVYLALLNKKNKLPNHLYYNIDEGLSDIELIHKKI
jgi:dTDP-4-dehydrorhamnose reductase